MKTRGTLVFKTFLQLSCCIHLGILELYPYGSYSYKGCPGTRHFRLCLVFYSVWYDIFFMLVCVMPLNEKRKLKYRSCLEQTLEMLKCCKTLAGSYSKGRILSQRQGFIMMSSSVLLISFLSETLVKDIFILFNDIL